MQRFKIKPHQEKGLRFLLRKKRCGLFMYMGGGKTATVLTALKILKDKEPESFPALIIAPLLVCQKVWPAELNKWDHLKGLTIKFIAGKANERIKIISTPVQPGEVYMVSRDLISWLIKYYGKRWPFKTVIIDEISSFKSQQSNRFKQLKKQAHTATRFVGLTGTPAPNNLLDIWAPLYLIDGGQRLGSGIGWYRNEYFEPDVAPGQKQGHVVYKWRLKQPSADKYLNDLLGPRWLAKEIHAAISDVCITVSSGDPGKPALINDVLLQLPDNMLTLYKRFKKHKIIEVGGEKVIAANPAVLHGKLLQFTGGCIYNQRGETVDVNSIKIERLQQLADELNGNNAIIAYNYKHERARITEALKQYSIVHIHDENAVERWNEGKIQFLLLNAASAAHGLNLQYGGHNIIYYSITASNELYQQLNKRLDRPGQQNTVVIHRMLFKDTVDTHLAKYVLVNKEEGQKDLMIDLL